MSNKTLMFSALAALAFASASAQSLREGYIEWPNTHNLAQYVKDWNNGTLQMEDEAFFISRVKPKARFRNSATQIDPSLTAENDKRMCLWLPLTTALGGQYNLNALPNSLFDSEVFSTWSYVDHYGNWTAPHGWVPGAFADVAHKNGVGVSSVASVPFGGISPEWRSTFDAQTKLSGTDIAKFMYYHGCDGLGYNSEWSGYGASGLAQQHEDIIKFLESKGNMVTENVWYDGTTTGGACSFDQG
ncbi:MAG: secretion protein, partial [Muribaculaceae bacterium]|nr:secretion protein [Muribaculaceae bacterium]